ncbi:putative sodium-coupled neutral amino acid transporter 7 [Zootermopsis nevadensis]|uniref:putative sodium-coupled neutral amino acid transporter 7 n=1 Tax=Zootermopsis nevadensis TaxID=136037 RepID=UPI000B8E8E89|nr:putative sodium-coupled neutral amino acid transporter 7 [Zootermopsis nevadensis]
MHIFLGDDDSVINSGNELWLTTVAGSNGEEEHDQQPAANGSSRLSAVFLIINAALGAGLLNFPQAFDQAGGIMTAVIVQVVLLGWIMGALLILAHCSDQTGARTLQEVLEGVYGRPGLIACSSAVALYCFGTCVTFLIIIGDQFDRVLSSLHGLDFCHYWYMNRNFTIVLSSSVFILPLCYSRRIDFLKYVSSVGVVTVVYVVILIVYQKYMGNFVPGPIKTSPTHWTDIFLVVPVICFGYQCHVSVIPVYACLRERNLNNFTLCASVAIAVCVATYTVAGIYGYLTFGSYVTSDVLESYSGSDILVLIGIVAVAIKTYTTYPILLFCGREAVSNLWANLLHDSESDVAVTERRRRITIATVWFILTLVLALLSPDIGSVIDILGSLAAIFIFVFPGLCLMQSTLHKDPHIILNKDKFVVLAAIIFILLGTFIFGVVFVQAAIRFYKKPPITVRLCI